MRYARAPRGGGRIKHWSTVPFTISPAEDEQDFFFQEDPVLPDHPKFCAVVVAGGTVTVALEIPKEEADRRDANDKLSMELKKNSKNLTIDERIDRIEKIIGLEGPIGEIN